MGGYPWRRVRVFGSSGEDRQSGPRAISKCFRNLDFSADTVRSLRVRCRSHAQRLAGLPPLWMTDARKLRLSLESTLDSIEAAELIVQRMAELNGFDQEQVHQIGMGVRETMANAVMHGNCLSPDKAVAFDASIDEEAFRVSVTDQGAGFDPDCVRDPLGEDGLLQASGRGLLMMRAFFDEVEIGSSGDTGTRVRLVKYRTTGAGETTQEVDQ